MITKRDLDVVNFIEVYGAASTTTITNIFYGSRRVAQRRLQAIRENKLLNYENDGFSRDYIYFTFNDKPKQLRHVLLRTEFLGLLHTIKEIELVKYKAEYECESVRPDMLLAYKCAKGNYIAFIEVEISHKGISTITDKYKKLYYSNTWKNTFPTFPKVIIITDFSIPSLDEFAIIKLKTDFSNIEALYK